MKDDIFFLISDRLIELPEKVGWLFLTVFSNFGGYYRHLPNSVFV